MSILDNFEQWKDFLGDRLEAAQQGGMTQEVINELAYRIGDYLSAEVEPKNAEERLLKALWDAGSEEEQKVLAQLMVKLVQNEGTTH
ncbi:hypothetical protein CathTA2_2575 [Caldalkalibacillus thermarum TA2.A1]|uniref:DUF3243 domain-containing protein n=1 Tax=Caldalkalibacillus thermarum (strain TA2.A1) TaxID=986075 RepID=F5L9S0_CALTT|nr:DUF3243 domain-containing protein [Caldalkalibacillus thermarum]EGL81919.1 hypothetical protein CathTA2_2575 [Caldalkalibacillus thermarum TA2.A1]QZT32962.1 DUF3243 domain-containing protein [Caldalkalibacillus thermarum TA2.A1]